MILIAAYYLAGIACLLVLDYADHLNLAGMANAVWAAVRRTQKTEALPAMWHVAAPTGETAELAVAARLFYLPRDGEYVGRHWAKARPDELEQLAEAFSDVIDLTHTVVGHRRTRRQPAWNGPTDSYFLPEFGDPAPVSPPYDYGAGSRHYVNLKPRVLDAKVHVDLTALRLRTSTMPVVKEDDDEWAVAS